MPKCPFCGNEFRYEDLLFFREMEQEAERGSSLNAQPVVDIFGSDNSTSGGWNGWSNPEPEEKDEAPAVEITQTEEKMFELGESCEDKIFGEFRKDYWVPTIKNPETGEKELYQFPKAQRFIVGWSADRASHGVGCGKVREGSSVPESIQLCPEDAAKAGGGATLTNMMCPHCHCALERAFLDAEVHRVILIGGPSAGKTAYELAALDELMNHLGRYRMGQQFRGIKMFGTSRQYFDVLQKAFANGEADATPLVPVFPMVFGIVGTGKQSVIVLHDAPGEMYNGTDRGTDMLAGNLGIQEADGAIMLVDAAQIFNQLGEKQADNQVQYNTSDIFKALDEFWAYESVGENIRNLALVVTKFDRLLSMSQGSNVFRGRGAEAYKVMNPEEFADHNGGVNKGTLSRVAQEVAYMIAEGYRVNPANPKEALKWLQREVLDRVHNDRLKADHIYAFSTSVYRYKKTSNGFEYVPNDEHAGLPRHRILEPMLYLMMQWGIVPVKTQGERVQEVPDNGPRPSGRGKPEKPERTRRWFSK